MATHSRFLPGESQGWRNLVDCRLWDHTESDMTEALASVVNYRLDNEITQSVSI